MSGFSNWFDPFGSNSALQNSTFPSQNSDDHSQNSKGCPNFSWPNMPPNPHIYPNNPMNAPPFEFSSQGHPPQGFQPYGYHSHWYPHQAYSPQGFTFSDSSRRNNVDRVSSDRRTPFSRKASMQDVENIDLSGDAHSNDDNHPTKKSRAYYSDAECELVAQCWIDISVDSVVGNDQRDEQMWKRIKKAYNENRPTNTPARELS
ncbi:uncharacterized protein LOC130998340 [Salvia miltiorrhiza]|uniref:uncharacterized protein LOC130998340 n=1 Tax=Salvia miltiorrhiza TaxID=226208 RepID=UPI0025AC265C|nr:uncharacterized protein LOC130998340 [Salvia miltiorrhiza]